MSVRWLLLCADTAWAWHQKLAGSAAATGFSQGGSAHLDRLLFAARSALCSNMYSALNAIAGHYNNFGTTAPIPKKRLDRLIKVSTGRGWRLW